MKTRRIIISICLLSVVGLFYLFGLSEISALRLRGYNYLIIKRRCAWAYFSNGNDIGFRGPRCETYEKYIPITIFSEVGDGTKTWLRPSIRAFCETLNYFVLSPKLKEFPQRMNTLLEGGYYYLYESHSSCDTGCLLSPVETIAVAGDKPEDWTNVVFVNLYEPFWNHKELICDDVDGKWYYVGVPADIPLYLSRFDDGYYLCASTEQAKVPDDILTEEQIINSLKILVRSSPSEIYRVEPIVKKLRE